jgi:hypothetical protein
VRIKFVLVARARIHHFMKHQLGTMDRHVINSHSQ